MAKYLVYMYDLGWEKKPLAECTSLSEADAVIYDRKRGLSQNHLYSFYIKRIDDDGTEVIIHVE